MRKGLPLVGAMLSRQSAPSPTGTQGTESNYRRTSRGTTGMDSQQTRRASLGTLGNESQQTRRTSRGTTESQPPRSGVQFVRQKSGAYEEADAKLSAALVRAFGAGASLGNSDEEDTDGTSDGGSTPLSYRSMDEEMIAQSMAELDRAVYRVHPKLRDVQTLIPEEEMKNAVEALRNPLLKLNASLDAGERKPREVGSTTAAPKLIAVTGHNGLGGGAGINGLYERHPDDYCGRPVYQKTLEKRAAVPQSPSGGSPLGRSGFVQRQPHRTPSGHFQMSRSQTARTIPPPAPAFGDPVMAAPSGVYFLFFADLQGCWCIGPRVAGSGSLYARCPGVEDKFPNALFNWETWDDGHKLWRVQRALRAVKAGT